MEGPGPHLARLACDFCRLRKLKCSRETPTCRACIQNAKVCHYSGRITRSPLTRVYVTGLEQRLRKLERLFEQLHPELDVDEAIKSDFVGDAAQRTTQSQPTAAATAGPSFTPSPQLPDESISERVPEEPDGFDWNEDVDDVADGMAALSVNPKGTGYLGSTAGVFFLRSLLNWKGYSKADMVAENMDGSREISPSEASATLSELYASRQVMERLMDGYFSIYHRTYPFIHEPTFRAQFHEVAPRPHRPSFKMLLHSVLALGAWCLNNQDTRIDDGLYHSALSLGDDQSVFESANLTLVQALILLSNLSQKRNKPNTGSNFLGLAIRMALSLGLHRELPDWDISLLQRETRRRVWWGLYIFDSGAATTFGRPILLPDRESMDVRHVLNIPDEYLTPGTTSFPNELPTPTMYSGLKYQSDLHMHSNHMSNALLSSSGTTPEHALSMNKSLDAWAETLPPYFRPGYDMSAYEDSISFAKYRLWWRLWNLKIIIFRQFMLKRAIEQTEQRSAGSPPIGKLDSECRDRAIEAASATIASINEYISNRVVDRLVTWYAMFFIFHASLVVALAAVGSTDPLELSRWQADLDVVREILVVKFASNPLAARCASVLNLIVSSSTNLADMGDLGDPDVDQALLDFSNWPSDIGQFVDYFEWPEF